MFINSGVQYYYDLLGIDSIFISNNKFERILNSYFDI